LRATPRRRQDPDDGLEWGGLVIRYRKGQSYEDQGRLYAWWDGVKLYGVLALVATAGVLTLVADYRATARRIATPSVPPVVAERPGVVPMPTADIEMPRPALPPAVSPAAQTRAPEVAEPKAPAAPVHKPKPKRRGPVRAATAAPVVPPCERALDECGFTAPPSPNGFEVWQRR
jgi:hypothetical protein